MTISSPLPRDRCIRILLPGGFADSTGKMIFRPEYHLHTLRHFFATFLLQNNTSKQVAAELLGHADTSFLERTYCHPQLESKQQAASVLAEWIQPAEDEAWEREQAQMKTGSVG